MKRGSNDNDARVTAVCSRLLEIAQQQIRQQEVT